MELVEGRALDELTVFSRPMNTHANRRRRGSRSVEAVAVERHRSVARKCSFTSAVGTRESLKAA